MSDSSLYYWEGRNLLMDTVVHRKRTINGPSNRQVFCPFDVRRWIMPPGDELIGTAWQRLSKKYRSYLGRVGRHHQHDAKAKVVWHFLVDQIKYEPDSAGSDFWQFPPETLMRGRGDCEDKSFLCVSLLLAAGIPASRIRVTIGAMVSSQSKAKPEGHAWPMYRNRQGTWCILEPNIPRLPIRVSPRAELVLPRSDIGAHQATFLTADRLSNDRCHEQYVPLVCMNHESVWTVEPTQPGSIRGAERLQPDWSRNPTFDQILRWRQ